MQKKYLIIIILGIISIGLILAIIIHQVLTRKIGPGTAFELYVIEGCDVINNLTGFAGPFSNFTLTDETTDKIYIEYGYKMYGLRKSSLRKYCEDVSNRDLCLEKNNGDEWNCRNIQNFSECIRNKKFDIAEDCFFQKK